MAQRFSDVHRSARVAGVSGLSVTLALALASALSVLLLHYAPRLAAFHQETVRRILVQTGMPVTGSARVKFPGKLDVPAPVIALTGYANRYGLMAAIGVIAAALMAVMSFRVEISRMLMILLFTLLCASLVNLLLGGSFGTDSVAFAAFWLRFEFAIWILLLFIMGLFAGIVLPAGWWLVFWTAAPTLYGMLWSAIRLSFCLGILHLTGPLLAPLLWFTMGSLADILYITVFYSFVAWHAARIRSSESN